jgi:hypothetical protein
MDSRAARALRQAFLEEHNHYVSAMTEMLRANEQLGD